MTDLFLGVVNLSIVASYIIIVVLLARGLLKKSARQLSYWLWGVVYVKLVVPFSIKSNFSLVPINHKVVPMDITHTTTPAINSGVALIDSGINRLLPSVTPASHFNPMQFYITLASYIWLTGFMLLLIYSAYRTIVFRRLLKNAVHLYDNISTIESFGSAFVFGIMKPHIYLPAHLNDDERDYIIKHEQVHIARRDHIIKFIAYLITCLHWFNPFVWLAFIKLDKDMEISCDEAVINHYGPAIQASYMRSLLTLSTPKRQFNGMPIAFGESNTKSRIVHLLNYKKPSFWLIAIATVLAIGLAIGLLSEHAVENSANQLQFATAITELPAIRQAAVQVIDKHIDSVKSYHDDLEFTEKQVTELQKMATFNNILDTPLELWSLKYRLKPNDPDYVVIGNSPPLQNG